MEHGVNRIVVEDVRVCLSDSMPIINTSRDMCFLST